jgi:hypothetical protein
LYGGRWMMHVRCLFSHASLKKIGGVSKIWWEFYWSLRRWRICGFFRSRAWTFAKESLRSFERSGDRSCFRVAIWRASLDLYICGWGCHFQFLHI